MNREKEEGVRGRIQDYFIELVNNCSPFGEDIERKDMDIIIAKMNVFYYEVLEQELDRAREEGIREGLEDILSEVENWKTYYLDTTKSEPSKTMQIGLVNVIRRMLSKLTTK